LHTIAWGVIDSAGRTEGIGSRFFTALNGAADAPTAGDSKDAPPTRALAGAAAPVTRGDARMLDAFWADGAEVRGRTGFDFDAPLDVAWPGEDGVRRVQLDELGRLELQLGPVESGYLVASGTLRDLPPGSQLDAATGRFTWAPGPGYVGTYHLAFVREGSRIAVDVTIRPRRHAAAGESEIRMFVDRPVTDQIVSGSFTVAGWALDRQAAIGSGIGAVHMWAQRRDVPGTAPMFVGSADLEGERPDVARTFGPQFDRAGYGLTASGLPPGRYDITVFAWNRRTARWEDARTVVVVVR
jgi:hypothetical protein